MAMPAPELIHSDAWLDRVGEAFARSLLREDLSPKTVRSYGTGLKNLFTYLRDQGVDDLTYLNRDLLEGWQDSMREQVPVLRSGSRALYGTAVRRLIRFAADHDLVDYRLERVIVGVRKRNRSQEKPREPISSEDLAVLMAYLGPRRPRMSVIDLRDRALFYVFLGTGVRANEALQMPRANYEHCRVRQKGGSYIDIELTATPLAMVEEYLRARHDDLPWLWVALGNNTNSVRQLADSGVREVWRRLCVRLGIPRFTTHQLRHTTATELRSAGVSEQAQADHLNHADTRTVHKYAHDRGGEGRRQTMEIMERLLRHGTQIAPEMLARRSRPGGRPRYGLR
jgi:site-specific recombinase XerD